MMTVLSGNTIRELGLVKNLTDKSIQPSSVDVRLSNEFIVYDEEILIPDEPLATKKFRANKILLIPNGYQLKNNKEYLRQKYKLDKIIEGGVLGTTIEWIKVPNNYVGLYTGRSSLARLFIESHQTAGLLDSGWKGNITLEMTASDKPVILKSGIRIGQVYFIKLDKKTFSYDGKYQNQNGVVESKIYKDFEKVDSNEVKKLYCLEGLSIHEIAEKLDIEVKDVLSIFAREGIDISKIEQGKSVNKIIYDIKD